MSTILLWQRGCVMRFDRLLAVLMVTLCVFWVSSASAAWDSTISGANPLHWFRFEETAGSTADDQGSANADGTYDGGVGLGTSGLVGNAASFDGIDDHVLVGGPNLTGDWTVETILEADTVSGGVSQGIIGNDFTAADRTALKAEQWNDTGQLGYTLFGVVDVTFTGAAAATPADYAHVTFVGTGAGVELFVNGVSQGLDTITTPLLCSRSSWLRRLSQSPMARSKPFWYDAKPRSPQSPPKSRSHTCSWHSLSKPPKPSSTSVWRP